MKLSEIIFIAKYFEMDLNKVQVFDHAIADTRKRVDIFTEIDPFGNTISSKVQYWQNYYEHFDEYVIYDTQVLGLPLIIDAVF
jgi:hypothetical protein